MEGFATYDISRTLTTSLLNAGADLHVMSPLAGHTSVESTKLYDWCRKHVK